MKKLAGGLLALVIAAFMSLVLAVPASAADPTDWFNVEGKKVPAKYHWGFDYWKYPTQSPPAGPASTYPRPSVPVSPSVNPSNTGGSYYFNQQKTRVTNPANTKPLTGTIIEPGKSVVRVPSTYAPISRFAVPVAMGFTKLWPGIGLGMGGTTLPPANWKELSASAGVPSACIEDAKNCDRASLDKMMTITNCGNGPAGTCEGLGAVGETGGSALNDWFKSDALPFLDSVWCTITSSCTNTDPIDSHNPSTLNKGCYTQYAIEPRADNNVTFHKKTTVLSAKPSNQVQGVYYDAFCSPDAQLKNNLTPQTSWEAVCIDATGKIASSNGSPFGGKQQITGSFVREDGTNIAPICSGGGQGVQPVKLLKIRIWSNGPIPPYDQAYYNGEGSGRYSKVEYSEWINPDPNLSTVEDTTITTTWDCTDALGKIWTNTQSTKGTAAAISPDCPAGSSLSRHDIKAKTPGQEAQTIDSGASVPGELGKYPDCAFGTCTIDVHVDGTRCTVGRQECGNWPAVNSTQPSRVKCMWGNYTVPTSDCYAISNGYKAETGVIYDPRSGTWIAPDAYGNPVMPNPEPWNQLNPTPQPGQAPTTGTGTGTGTTPGTGGFPGVGTSPSDNCVSPAWSWNPVDWVKSPAVCAIRDSFEPKTDVAARMQTISASLTTHPPFSWFSPVFTGPSGGGCPNWNIVLPNGTSTNAVCDSSFTAAITGVRAPMFGLLAAAMVWPLIRSLWYAAIPILRVTPSGGK